MSDISLSRHDHFFLGEGEEKNERRTWMVIGLCTFMMVVEVVGGLPDVQLGRPQQSSLEQ